MGDDSEIVSSPSSTGPGEDPDYEVRGCALTCSPVQPI